MGRKALTVNRGPLDGRRRRLIPACQGDREYVRNVEKLIRDGAQARSLGAKGFRV